MINLFACLVIKEMVTTISSGGITITIEEGLKVRLVPRLGDAAPGASKVCILRRTVAVRNHTLFVLAHAWSLTCFIHDQVSAHVDVSKIQV
jgi:hypothetical protein